MNRPFEHMPKPTGHYVLVKIESVKETTDSGLIIRSHKDMEREHSGRDIGRIISFGPTCFEGYSECKTPKDWGCSKGDLVEFTRYAGKPPRLADKYEELKDYRIIVDSDIIATYPTLHEEL